MHNNNNINLNFKNDNRMNFYNQMFSKKINLNSYLKSGALSGITFLYCRFEERFFMGNTIVNCYFENCIFDNVIFRKFEINDCIFSNCQLVDGDLTRTEFYKTSFIKCRFQKTNLRASTFIKCKIKEIYLKDSNLELLSLLDVKFWKFNKWITIKDSDTLILKEE